MRILLAAVVAVGLAAVAGAVIVGTRVFDGTVVESPYERGIAWDRERSEVISSGLQVSLLGNSFRTGDNLAAFRVLRHGRPFRGTSIAVVRSRPSSASHDRTFTAPRGVDGIFRAMVDLPLQGHWELVAVVEEKEGSVRFPHSVYAEKRLSAKPSLPCDLNRGPCTALLQGSGRELAFDIAPKPVKTMAPLEFSVALGPGGAPKEAITIRLSMPGMYMGENSVQLQPNADGLWRGEGVIVRCPSGRKNWRAEITVPGEGTTVLAFEVDR
jgi:nitrogen fixation protein FixH